MAIKTNLQKEVQLLLNEYGAKAASVTDEVITQVVKDATKKLKAASPRKSGEYAKGWTYRVEKGRISTSATIYGKRQTFPLAHLLEYGHAKRNGGRVAGIEHIKPVEEWAVKETEERIVRRLET